jgi:predicted nucleic acid-binding protein
MTKYVICPDVALQLAHDEAVIRKDRQLLAPALLRSQLLSLLYQAVRRGEMTKKDAGLRLNYVRGLPIRLLGDRVLQNVAWQVADQLGWPDTLDAEYVALTKLQADALITLDPKLADAVKDLVTVAPIEALSLLQFDVGDDGPPPRQGRRAPAAPAAALRVTILPCRRPRFPVSAIPAGGGDAAGQRFRSRLIARAIDSIVATP